MAPHPWCPVGAWRRKCAACGRVQRKTPEGTWRPKYPPDCDRLSNDDDGRRGPRPRKPKPPAPTPAAPVKREKQMEDA